MYEKYADIVIDEEGKDLEASLRAILEKTLKDRESDYYSSGERYSGK